MKTIYPDYYPLFHCIAGRCRHSCCIGWEIDIDADSLARYDAMPGPLGERLRRQIDRTGSEAHFRLTEEDRCPFLNGKGLCELILERGKGALCNICADHPRFRNAFSDRVEMGLGLCCEAACALILNREKPVHLICPGGMPDPSQDVEENAFFRWRAGLLALAQDRTLPVERRMDHILESCGMQPLPKPAFWLPVYRRLERLDAAWTAILERSCAPENGNAISSFHLENLLVYFLYRHLPAGFDAGDLPLYTAFSVLSARMIAFLCRDPAELPEIARLYSAEIEYSDQNVDMLLDAIYESEE